MGNIQGIYLSACYRYCSRCFNFYRWSRSTGCLSTIQQHWTCWWPRWLWTTWLWWSSWPSWGPRWVFSSFSDYLSTVHTLFCVPFVEFYIFISIFCVLIVMALFSLPSKLVLKLVSSHSILTRNGFCAAQIWSSLPSTLCEPFSLSLCLPSKLVFKI